jgi:hypothetical protein
MNTKTTLWLPLAAALTIGLVACGGGSKPAPKPAADSTARNVGAASGAANAGTAAQAQPDAALQNTLQQAALTASDLPGAGPAD